MNKDMEFLPESPSADAGTPAPRSPVRQQIGDDSVRFILRERWAPGPLIGWLGMNPSDASAERTDPTWMRWRGFAERWGYGGQIVGNPVPFRSASPEDAIAILREIAHGRAEGAKLDLVLNRVELKKVAAEPDVWVLGWGDKGAAMNTTYRVIRPTIEAMKLGGARNFAAFGLTASGNPKHVLARGTSRIPDDAQVYPLTPSLLSLLRVAWTHAAGRDGALADGVGLGPTSNAGDSGMNQ